MSGVRRPRLGVFGIRLGIFLLFLVFVLAMASSPAGAQVAPSLPGVLKPDKGAEQAAKKAAEEAKKAAEKAAKAAARDEHEDDGEDEDYSGPGDGDDDDHGPGDDDDEPADVGAPGDNEDEPEDDEQPADDGASGAPGAGKTGGPGGPSQSGPKSPTGSASTDHSGAADGPQSSSAKEPGCTGGCGSPTDVGAEGQGDSILASDSGGELQAASRAFSYTEPANAGPGVLALFALMALGLAVGIAGGVSALRGRLRED
jgi:hypothetical protein